jgi:hypothetical protein
MKFRLRALGWHLLASASVLTLVLGSLYLGWYRWPGWYAAGASSVALVLIAVDVTVGPLLTLVVAKSTKPRAELARDIGIIATLQLCALVYGTVSLWTGRPLYYALSAGELDLVQGSDINPQELRIARQQHAALVPHWYSLPRWIWAPLPENPDAARKIVMSAFDGGDDVTAMPRYYQPWPQGLTDLRKRLKRVDELAYFSRGQKTALKARMHSLGVDTDKADAMPLVGRGPPLLVVFDPASLQVRQILAAPATRWSAGHRFRIDRYLQALVPHQQAKTRH